ncbi:MAG: hypothetical protein AAFS01_05530 [Pseudomonadota bacterium]
MTNKTQPLYRAKFCPIVGTDETGKDQLGRAIEIGAVWQRPDASKGAILKFDLVPADIQGGVLLLQPIDTKPSRSQS